MHLTFLKKIEGRKVERASALIRRTFYKGEVVDGRKLRKDWSVESENFGSVYRVDGGAWVINMFTVPSIEISLDGLK